LVDGAGVGLLHGVDACHLDKTFQLANHAFDRIVFNFPHAGKQRVHINRALISEFLASAALFVKRPHGQIHLTLKLQ
jgi:25S rRNA (uracil2634-N3)-methyltransferase